MGVPDPSVVLAAKERGIITAADAAALIKAASISLQKLSVREGPRPRLPDDGKLMVSAQWLPAVPTGQPTELPDTPLEAFQNASSLPELPDQCTYEISDAVAALASFPEGDVSAGAVQLPDTVDLRSSPPASSMRVDNTMRLKEEPSSSALREKCRFEQSTVTVGETAMGAEWTVFSSARRSKVERMQKFVNQTAYTVGNLMGKLKSGKVDVEAHLMRGRFGTVVMPRKSKSVKYKKDIFGLIASSKYFETITLLAISVNALWIGVDMELNQAATWLDAHLVFQIADNAFCFFFTFEVVVRFLALSNKAKCCELSFIFDVALVLLMIFETWVLAVWAAAQSGDGSGQGLRQLSILRLLRLLRLTRMGRLMKMIPELMTLIRGMFAALRSVATTLVFLVSIMWIFGIIFVQVYGDQQDNPLFEFFSRLGISMVTLFVNGTLLDDLNVVANLLLDDSIILLTIFFFFVLISSLTLLNMLIGVLTQVVADVASEEKEKMSVSEATRTLQEVFNVADVNGDHNISKWEFESIITDQAEVGVQALMSLGINQDRLKELSRQLFEDEDADIEFRNTRSSKRNSQDSMHRACSFVDTNWVPKELSFAQFIDELILLKPGNSVSVRDVMGLRRHSTAILRTFEKGMADLREDLDDLVKDYNHRLKIEDQASSPYSRPSTSTRVEDVAPQTLHTGLATSTPVEHVAPQMLGTGPTTSTLVEHVAPQTQRTGPATSTFVEHVLPQRKLSNVPTDMLFDELQWRLRTRQQQCQGMDDTQVEAMP